MDRRTLLKLIALNSLTSPFSLQAEGEVGAKHKRLILIELKGGNDGLNTVIPYQDSLYYKLRPTIAIEKEKVLQLNETIGLHPSMQGMKDIFDQNELAVIQGVQKIRHARIDGSRRWRRGKVEQQGIGQVQI